MVVRGIIFSLFELYFVEHHSENLCLGLLELLDRP